MFGEEIKDETNYDMKQRLHFLVTLNIIIIILTVCLITSVLLTSKTFSKFYHRHYELISKFNVGLSPVLTVPVLPGSPR